MSFDEIQNLLCESMLQSDKRQAWQVTGVSAEIVHEFELVKLQMIGGDLYRNIPIFSYLLSFVETLNRLIEKNT